MRRPVKRLSAGFKGLVDPQAGALAAIAILIGLSNTAFQVRQWLQGPEVRLLPFEQILVVPDDEYPGGQTFIRFATRVSYVNSGATLYNAIVLREKLIYAVGDALLEQDWHSWENFSGRGCELSSASSEDVRPVAVNGNNIASHVTFFAPRAVPEPEVKYRNYLPVSKFLDYARSNNRIRFVLLAELEDHVDLSTDCHVLLNESEIARIEAGCSVMVPCFTE